MIKVFAWNPNRASEELFHRLINAAFGDKEARLIIDLSISEPHIDKGDILIASGTRCHNIIQAKEIAQNVLKIPLPRDLYDVPINKETRVKTFQALQDLASNKDITILKTLELKPEELKEYTLEQLSKLKETLESKNIDHWILKTIDGKRIALVLTPQTQVQNCHAILTFEEIFAAKLAVDVLNLESIVLIIGDK